MKPKIVTTIMTNSNSKNNTNNTTNSGSKCLPILIAKLLQGDTGGGGGAGGGTVVCVLYGDVQKPAFERIVSGGGSGLVGESCLVVGSYLVGVVAW